MPRTSVMPMPNIRIFAETVLVYAALSFLAVQLLQTDMRQPYRILLHVPLLLLQGLWLYRCYIVGHEAAHAKLAPGSMTLNDLLGGLVLLPLMVPVTVYRKIHAFHHGYNRRDVRTSSLDTFVVRGRPAWWKVAWCHLLWYLAVFCGGFYIHSLVSVLLFLFVPPSLSRRISPAFRQWTWGEQIRSILLFFAGAGLHLVVFLAFGSQVYWHVLGLPMLSFAWILSLLLYIFHYDTTQGDMTRYNVRSLDPVPVLSWVLMNFQEHATHHQYPNIPWYELPERRRHLPPAYAEKNQKTRSFFKAVWDQWKGPRIVYET